MIYRDFMNSRGQATASIVGDLLRKTIGTQHILRRPCAIGFDWDHIQAAEEAGVKRILVRDRDSGRVYRTSFETFLARGFEVNRGFGRQRALALHLWQVEGGDPSSATLIETPKMVDPGQLSLF